MSTTRIAVTLCAAAVVVACRAAPEDPAPAAPEPEAPVAAVAWKDMTMEQRADYMKRVVLPTMKPKFAAWEPHEFSDMKCSACHGEGAKDKSFKMPNPDLPMLPTDPAGFQALAKEEPQAFKFMTTVVVPTMADLLGEPKFDHTTGQGFGCFRCHTAEK